MQALPVVRRRSRLGVCMLRVLVAPSMAESSQPPHYAICTCGQTDRCSDRSREAGAFITIKGRWGVSISQAAPIEVGNVLHLTGYTIVPACDGRSRLYLVRSNDPVVRRVSADLCTSGGRS